MTIIREISLTLKAINLWYGFGAQAYISILSFRAITKNLIRSYFTIRKWTAPCKSPTFIHPFRFSTCYKHLVNNVFLLLIMKSKWNWINPNNFHFITIIIKLIIDKNKVTIIYINFTYILNLMIFNNKIITDLLMLSY